MAQRGRSEDTFAPRQHYTSRLLFLINPEEMLDQVTLESIMSEREQRILFMPSMGTGLRKPVDAEDPLMACRRVPVSASLDAANDADDALSGT